MTTSQLIVACKSDNLIFSPDGILQVPIAGTYHVVWRWFYWHVRFGGMSVSITKFLFKEDAHNYAQDLNAAFTAGRFNRPPVIATAQST